MNFARGCRKPVLALLGILVIALSTLASGEGGWISSGGELFRFARNPWFVRNTDRVYYCVVIDATGVSATAPEIKQTVREAIQYWKSEFGAVQSPGDRSVVHIATQNFIEQDTCSASTDLRLLFGYGTLTEAEIKFLKDPRKYVGVSVRTDYDNVNLKGRGFIYISSDRGPHAYHNPGHLIEKAWENLPLLKYALMHEFGHVFGIPHTGTGLMSEVFLDQMLHKKFSKIYQKHPAESYLRPPENFLVCPQNGTIRHEFFGLTTDVKCLKFVQGEVPGAWKVFKQTAPESTPEEIGEVVARTPTASALGGEPSLILHLPDEQKVFGLNDRLFNNFILGPPVMNFGFTGFYRTTSSRKPHPVYLHLSSKSVSIVGQVGAGTVPVMVYSPPTLLEKLSPIELP